MLMYSMFGKLNLTNDSRLDGYRSQMLKELKMIGVGIINPK